MHWKKIICMIVGREKRVSKKKKTKETRGKGATDARLNLPVPIESHLTVVFLYVHTGR
jgi:hypothetical protein